MLLNIPQSTQPIAEDLTEIEAREFDEMMRFWAACTLRTIHRKRQMSPDRLSYLVQNLDLDMTPPPGHVCVCNTTERRDCVDTNSENHR